MPANTPPGRGQPATWLLLWVLTAIVAHALGFALSLGLTWGGVELYLLAFARPSASGLAPVLILTFVGPLYVLTVLPPLLLLGGAACGALQQRILRRRVPAIDGWVVATAWGWLLGGLALVPTLWLIRPPAAALVAAGVCCGLALGGLQRLALPPTTPLARWWIPAMLCTPRLMTSDTCLHLAWQEVWPR